jgi:hypothetical protein
VLCYDRVFIVHHGVLSYPTLKGFVCAVERFTAHKLQ